MSRRQARAIAGTSVRSPAGPTSPTASVHSAVASTCGHSSPQRSAVGSDRRRRSCVTIASCHATRRARSDAASAVSVPKLGDCVRIHLQITSGGNTCRVLVFEPALKRERSVVAVRLQPAAAAAASERVRLDRLLPSYERPAEQAVSVPRGIGANSERPTNVDHRGSHFRHRLYKGGRRTMELRKAT